MSCKTLFLYAPNQHSMATVDYLRSPRGT